MRATHHEFVSVINRADQTAQPSHSSPQVAWLAQIIRADTVDREPSKDVIAQRSWIVIQPDTGPLRQVTRTAATTVSLPTTLHRNTHHRSYPTDAPPPPPGFETPHAPHSTRHGDPGRTSRDAPSRLERSAHGMHIGRIPATCRAGELVQNPLWTLLSWWLDHENALDFRREHKEDQTRAGRLGVGALRAGRRRKSTAPAYEPIRQLAELDLAHALIDSDRLQSTSAAQPVRGPPRGNRPIRTNERDRHDPPGDVSATATQNLASGRIREFEIPTVTIRDYRNRLPLVVPNSTERLLGRSGSAISLVRRRNNPNRRTFPDLLRDDRQFAEPAPATCRRSPVIAVSISSSHCPSRVCFVVQQPVDASDHPAQHPIGRSRIVHHGDSKFVSRRDPRHP